MPNAARRGSGRTEKYVAFMDCGGNWGGFTSLQNFLNKPGDFFLDPELIECAVPFEGPAYETDVPVSDIDLQFERLKALSKLAVAKEADK